MRSLVCRLPLISQERDSPAVAHRRTLLEEGDQLGKRYQGGESGLERGTLVTRSNGKLLNGSSLKSSNCPGRLLTNCEARSLGRAPTDRYPSDSDWSNAVGELIVKRSQVLKQEWTEKVSAYAKADVSCCTFHKKTLRMALRSQFRRLLRCR